MGSSAANAETAEVLGALRGPDARRLHLLSQRGPLPRALGGIRA
jgi:hypothetical protein